MAARLTNLDAETLWSRVWVLVDGGYVDNSALTPTLHAIDIIDAERKREGETAAGAPKPFTDTRVHIVHISNDPGEPCLRVPEGSRERLSAQARAFLDKTGQTITCASDVARLEGSMRQSTLYSFVAPIEALLSARTEHSREAVARLEETIAARRSEYVLEMRDLATVFADAYGTGLRLQGHSEAEIARNALNQVKAADTFAASRRELVSESIDRPTQPDAAHVYFRALSEWQEMVRREAREVECHKRYSPLGPPLGWTLRRNNQELMKCLSLRDRLAGIASRQLDPPYVPFWGEYTTDEARFRELREQRMTLQK